MHPLPTTFLSGWVVNLLYGQEYAQAGGVLALHIWTGVFVGLGAASGKWFLTENFTKIMFHRTALGAVCNVFLNIIFIAKFSIYGAACATLISQILAAYLYDISRKETLVSFVMKSRSFIFLPRWIYAKISL